MSKRQDILGELRRRLATIAISNGFQTDAGATLFIGETPELGADDPSAAIAIVIGEDQPDDHGDDVLTTLPIDVQAVAKTTLDDPWGTVEAVLADVRKAIENGSRSLDGLLTRDLLRGRTRTLEREPGSTTVGVAAMYATKFLERWGEP